MWRMALKDTALIPTKKQKGLSNFTTRKFHLTNHQNPAEKVVRCTLKTRLLGKSGQFGSVWSLSPNPKEG
jgi:hypothetical protein